MTLAPFTLIFDWDRANVDHIALHRVLPSEAEQVIRNGAIPIGEQVVDGEERFQDLGITNQGRILVVVTTPRGIKIRVVTAYTADKNRQDYWFKHTGDQHDKT